MDRNQRIEGYRDEMAKALSDLIRIPSVSQGQGTAGAPFGEGCRRALDEVFSLARRLGFEKLYDDDGYAGHVEMGQGEECIGVLTHVDVVPAGDGWTVEPFSGLIRDNCVYGRGSTDNKNAVIAGLYAMRALREENPVFYRRVRLVIGCDEERGMECMDHYEKSGLMPDYGFAPDAQYPLINMEKGILSIWVKKECTRQGKDGIRVLSFKGGTAMNVVPSQAEMVLECGSEDLATLIGLRTQEFCEKEHMALTPAAQGSRVTILSQGRSAHASTPQLGTNAIAQLLAFLCTLPLAMGDTERLLLAAFQKIGFQTNGENLQLLAQDDSGNLTMSLDKIDADQEHVSFGCDVRYPVTMEYQYIVERFQRGFASHGCHTEITHQANGHKVDAHHPLVQKLLKVYQEQTGNEAYCMAIGGGTYARKMPNRAVAFGMRFAGTPERAHTPDERMDIDELVKNTQIIAHALYELACTKW